MEWGVLRLHARIFRAVSEWRRSTLLELISSDMWYFLSRNGAHAYCNQCVNIRNARDAARLRVEHPEHEHAAEDHARRYGSPCSPAGW